MLQADDFNGASWRRRSVPDQQFDSRREEAFENAKLPVPPGTTLLWRPGGVPSEWTDAFVFVKLPRCHSEWLIRKQGLLR